jgi:hypothetical protein
MQSISTRYETLFLKLPQVGPESTAHLSIVDFDERSSHHEMPTPHNHANG